MNKHVKHFATYIFYSIEVILGILIVADFNFISAESSNYLRYIAVIVSAIFAIIVTLMGEIGKKRIIVLSYLFILGADYFLIFHDGEELSNIGIYLFILAQFCYQFYINKSKYVPFLFCFAGTILIVIYIILEVTDKVDQFNMSQTLPAVFYYSAQIYNLITILVVSIKHRKFLDNLLFFSSILALLLCDTSIGLFNLTGEHIYSILTWAFYVPHHILMVTFLSKKVSNDDERAYNTFR